MAKSYAQLMQGDDQVQKNGAALFMLTQTVRLWAERGIVLRGLTVRWPVEEGDDFLLTARFETESGPVVAFHSADELGALVRGYANKMRLEKLKLREDRYGKGNGS